MNIVYLIFVINFFFWLMYIFIINKKEIKAWWKDYRYKRSIYPFIEEDFKYPCFVFAREDYMGHYGCNIKKPDGTEVVIWTMNPNIHPNVTYDEKFYR